MATAVLLWWMFSQFRPMTQATSTNLNLHSTIPAGQKPTSVWPMTKVPATPDAAPPEKCYTRAILNADPDVELAQQWFRRNLPDPSDLPKQARSFTVTQLEAEAASGDVDAMFKLGIKYMWAGIKPHRDPHLNVSPLTPDQQRHYSEKSRFWLWKAALHGRLQALGEISLAEGVWYRYENKFKISSEIRTLAAAYRLLMQEINADFAWAVGVRSDDLVLNADEKAQVIPLLATLRTKWQQQRQEMGQPFKLDLVVPDYVKTYEQKLTQLCASEWNQPAL